MEKAGLPLNICACVLGAIRECKPAAHMARRADAHCPCDRSARKFFGSRWFQLCEAKRRVLSEITDETLYVAAPRDEKRRSREAAQVNIIMQRHRIHSYLSAIFAFPPCAENNRFSHNCGVDADKIRCSAAL